MSRGRLDEPGFMESLLADIDAKPREYWIALIERYENEKPGDVVLPGIPPRRTTDTKASPSVASKKPQRKHRKAA